MAVQQWELVERERRPSLELVITAPAPPKGRPGLAALFVIFVALAVGAPSIASGLEADPEAQRWVPRPRPATEISSIDGLGPITKSGRPASGEPVAGMLFVRCTRLWSAAPDGSHTRKVLEMPGISSPAIAPNARTIAFLLDTGTGQELWLAGADGTDPTRVGALTSDGAPVLARATALTWSPKGSKLAFALVDGRYAEFEGGSAVWTLDLDSGRFTRHGTGWPAPFWTHGKVAYASMRDAHHVRFESPTGGNRDWLLRSARISAADRSASLVPLGYSDNTNEGIAVLRTPATAEPSLVVKGLYRGKRHSFTPPPGYRFGDHARPSISQDGTSVAIDLVDGRGERDLGVVSVSSGRWNVLDYAWEAVESPMPAANGPVGAQRALTIVQDLFANWNDGGTKRNLLVEREDRHLFKADERWGAGHVMSDPIRSEDGWLVPATVFLMRDGIQTWRTAEFRVGAEDGRVTVDVDAGPVNPLATVSDAIGFTESALGRDVVAPAIPADSELMLGSLYAWSYNGSPQVSFQAGVPFETERGLKEKDMGFGYGDDLDFSLGCGGEVDPQEITLGSIPALVDTSYKTHQVIWPSTLEARTGTTSVYGSNISKEEVVEIARTMASNGD